MWDCTLCFELHWDASVPWQMGLTFSLKTSCEGEGTLVGSSPGLGLTQHPWWRCFISLPELQEVRQQGSKLNAHGFSQVF